MAFYCSVLQDILKDDAGANPPKEDLTPLFREAYTAILAPHATWLMNVLFEVVLKGVPNRAQFLEAAQGDGEHRLTEEALIGRFREYVVNLEACNTVLAKCLIQNGYTP